MFPIFRELIHATNPLPEAIKHRIYNHVIINERSLTE